MRGPLFLESQFNIIKKSILSKLINKCNQKQIKITMNKSYFLEVNKLFLKFIMKVSKNSWEILIKNNRHVKLYQIVKHTIIKLHIWNVILVHEQKDQWNINPKSDPSTNQNSVYDKDDNLKSLGKRWTFKKWNNWLVILKTI